VVVFVPPVLNPVVVVFFSLFCCCLLVQIEDFLVQVRDERRLLVVPAEMLLKLDLQDSPGISSTRTFLLRPSPVLVVIRRVRVVRSCSARDQHALGFSFHGLAREGHRLLLRSRKVMIRTPEGCSAQRRFPEKVRVLEAQSPAAVLTVLASGIFSVCIGCTFLSLFHSLLW
jgi:hypothetical protein